MEAFFEPDEILSWFMMLDQVLSGEAATGCRLLLF